MATLILDDEQARIARSASAVELKDCSGNVIGRYVLDELEDLRIIKERMANPKPKSTRAEVKERLEAARGARTPLCGGSPPNKN